MHSSNLSDTVNDTSKLIKVKVIKVNTTKASSSNKFKIPCLLLVPHSTSRLLPAYGNLSEQLQICFFVAVLPISAAYNRWVYAQYQQCRSGPNRNQRLSTH